MLVKWINALSQINMEVFMCAELFMHLKNCSVRNSILINLLYYSGMTALLLHFALRQIYVVFSANFCTVCDFLTGWVRWCGGQKAKTGCTWRASSNWHIIRQCLQSTLKFFTAMHASINIKEPCLCYLIMSKQRPETPSPYIYWIMVTRGRSWLSL